MSRCSSPAPSWRVGHPVDSRDRCRLRGQDDRALDVLARLVVVHQHLTRLVLDRADELVHQPGEQRLLEEDEEHEQTHRTGEQSEAQLGASHLL